MSAELTEGLRLAGSGMGLVFATLVVLMLILYALGKLFPDESPEEPAGEPAAEQEVTPAAATLEEPAPEALEPPPFEAQPAPVLAAIPEPQPAAAPAAVAPAARQGVPGAKVAALAVAVYLAMEQEEAHRAVAPAAVVENAASQTDPLQQQPSSSWSGLGRAALWRSQGRRPPAYGQKPHSAYNPHKGRRT